MARELKLKVLPDPAWEYDPPRNHGPYRKAPAEYGGEYWLVTPFSDPKPWLKQEREQEQALPAGFVKIFRELPKWADYQHLGTRGVMAFEAAKVVWFEELKGFKGVGTPPNYDAALIAESEAVLVKWQLGKPAFYEGRFGWMGRFLDSEIWDYDSSAWQIINYPHHVVSTYQVTNFRRTGVPPLPGWHPFVPLARVTTEDDEG